MVVQIAAVALATPQSSEVFSSSAMSFQVFSDINSLQDEKNGRINSPDILKDTRDVLNNLTRTQVIQGEEITRCDPGVAVKCDYHLRRDSVLIPEMLKIFPETEMYDPADFNNTDVLDFLLGKPPNAISRPTDYAIYTNFTTTSGHTNRFTRGAMRPHLSVLNTADDGLFTDTTANINVDGATNGGGGNDIAVTASPWMDDDIDYSLENSSGGFIPLPISIPGINQNILIRFAGGINLDINRLNPSIFSADDFVSLDVYILKSISYAGQNHIIVIGMTFTTVVNHFRATISAENIVVELGRDRLQNLIQTGTISGGQLAEISGPFTIDWTTYTELMPKSLTMAMGMGKVEWEVENESYRFRDRTWVEGIFTPRPGENTVPTEATLVADKESISAPFTAGEWSANIESDVRIRFVELNEQTTFTQMRFENFPTSFNMVMNKTKHNDINMTQITYDASSAMDLMAYDHFEFFEEGLAGLTPHRFAAKEVDYLHLGMELRHLPKRFYMEAPLEQIEAEEPPDVQIGANLLEDFLNSLISRLFGQFNRIATTLRSAPLKVLNIGVEDGKILLDTFGDPIESITLYATSGDYVTSTDSYFAFYNNTRPSQHEIYPFALSARIEQVSLLDAVFGEENHMKATMGNGGPLTAYFVDDINGVYTKAAISNLPRSLELHIAGSVMTYKAVSGNIESFTYISQSSSATMRLKLLGVPEEVSIFRPADRIAIDTHGGELGSLEFFVTTNTSRVHSYPNNHILMEREPGYSFLSGKLANVSSINYIPGKDGRFELDTTVENTLTISVRDTIQDYVEADVVVNPLPKHFSINLTGLVEEKFIELPDLNVSDILAYVDVIYALASLGDDIIKIAGDTAGRITDRIGTVGTDVSFAFDANEPVSIFGTFKRGQALSLDDVYWTHGISAVQKETSSGIELVGKFFIDRLPRQSSIEMQNRGNSTMLNLKLEDYNPRYNWLLMDVVGIKGKDAQIYLSEIPDHVDLEIDAEYSTEILTPYSRKIDAIVDIKVSKALGPVYLLAKEYSPIIFTGEVMIPKIPGGTHIFMNVFEDVDVQFESQSGLDYIYAKMARQRGSEFHDSYVLIENVPGSFSLKTEAGRNFDMDGSLFAALPTVEMEAGGVGTGADGVQLAMHLDGNAIGQRGNMDMRVSGFSGSLEGSYDSETGYYSIVSEKPVDFQLEVRDVPVTETFELVSLKLSASRMKRVVLSQSYLYGGYPIIELPEMDSGGFTLSLENRYPLLGSEKEARLFLLDLRFTEWGLPLAPAIMTNDAAVKTESGCHHIIIPMPIATIFSTILS